MSFYAGLLAAQAGQSDARRDAYKQALAQQGDVRDFAEKQREFDATSGETKRVNDAALRSSGVDPTTGQPYPFTPPKGVQEPKGNDSEGFVNYYLRLADAASQQNRPDLATTYTALANQYGLGAERAAVAGYRGAQSQEIRQGKIPEEQARAQYYQQRLGVDLQKAKMQLEAAHGHDAARVQGAQIAADAAIKRAGITGQAAIDAHILAGYYALQGRSMQDATQIAITNARDATAYAAAQGKTTGAMPAFAPVSAPDYQPAPFEVPTLPNITFNVSGGGSGSGASNPVPNPNAVQPTVPSPKPAAKPNASRAKKSSGVDQQLVQKTAEIVRQQRAAGKSDADIDAMARSAGIPEDQIQAALHAAGASQYQPPISNAIGSWYLH